MKDLRSQAVGALCFCILSLTVPQVDALHTREGQTHALEANIQQRIALAQKEMQANAMALAIQEIESPLKKEMLDLVRRTLMEFSKEMITEFNPTFEQTCQRVVHEAMLATQEPHEGGNGDPAAYAFAQLKETALTKDTCDTSGPTFKPTGTVTGSFLEQRGFWDSLKGTVGGMAVLAKPLMEKLTKQLGHTLKGALKKFLGPEMRAEVSEGLNRACEAAIQQEEEDFESAHTNYGGHPGAHADPHGR